MAKLTLLCLLSLPQIQSARADDMTLDSEPRYMKMNGGIMGDSRMYYNHFDPHAMCIFEKVQTPLPNFPIAEIQKAVHASLAPVPFDSKDCFRELTTSDRQFLQSLSDQLTSACQGSGKTLNNPLTCETEARQIWTNAFLRLKNSEGVATLNRVLAAIQSNLQMRKTAEALTALSDPKLATPLRNFAKSYSRYLKSLSYTHLLDSEQPKAAQALLWSMIAFNKTVSEMQIPEEEKKQLTSEAQALYSSAGKRYEYFRENVGEKANLALETSQGLSSALLLIASIETMGPAMVATSSGVGAGSGLKLIADGLKAVAWGGAAWSTMNALPETVTATLHNALTAWVDSSGKKTDYFCELSKQVALNSDIAISDTWNAFLKGGAIGGSYLAGTFAVGRALPKVGPIINTLASLALYGKMGYEMFQMHQMRQTDAQERAETLAELKKRTQDGEMPPGQLKNETLKLEENAAYDHAMAAGDATMIGSMIPHASMLVPGRSGGMHDHAMHGHTHTMPDGHMMKMPPSHY